MEQEKTFQQPEQRQLKIYERYIPRSCSRNVFFPEIRLCGKWLQDLGFNTGQSVTVSYEEGKIIITKIKSEGSE